MSSERKKGTSAQKQLVPTICPQAWSKLSLWHWYACAEHCAWQLGMSDGNRGHAAEMPQLAACIAGVHCGLLVYQSLRSSGITTWPIGREVKETPMQERTLRVGGVGLRCGQRTCC